MAERGIDITTINNTLANGVTVQQTTDKFMFISQQATVIATRSGHVITTWAYSDNTQNIIDLLQKLFGG